jgi:hypothetical protein
LTPYKPSDFVAIKLKTMNSNPDNSEEKSQASASAKATSIDSNPKSTQTPRPASHTSSKDRKKAPKNSVSKRSSTGLHDHDSDISKDCIKKKPSQPPGKPNGDIRTMFPTTDAAGTKATVPYVPEPMVVTQLMRQTTKHKTSDD